MSLVTITDHNTIAGALEIAHLPNTFISEEVTTYFPEDRCKIHVLTFHITEKQHENIQSYRENIYELVSYLDQEKVAHAVAHPLYSINDRLNVEHFERLLLLFKTFELNGARDGGQNRIVQTICSQLTASDLEILAEKHTIEPHFPEPWVKSLIGGSDDHSSLNIARLHTEVKGVRTVEEFLRGMENGKAQILGQSSTPETLAHNLYSIAYQFYKHRLNLERHVHKDLVLRFLDRFLQGHEEPEGGMWSRLYCFWNQRRKKKSKSDSSQAVKQLFKSECQKLIWDDPELRHIMKNGNGGHCDSENKWFEFVNKLSNKIVLHFGNHLLDRLSGANVFDIFTSIGSAGTLYSLLAPYFVSFSLFARDRQLANDVSQRLIPECGARRNGTDSVRVAHFTDTFYEVNGVALTLQQQVKTAVKTGKKLTVITCDDKAHIKTEGIENFIPVGVYDLPEYPEMKLFYPPFMEMLSYCYQQEFTNIHSATPGPIGLAALAISRILKLPLTGTYHTSLPQYARYLTEDDAMEGLMWKYVVWYYDQMNLIFVPSQSTGEELVEKGIHPEKIRLYPRGIDIERFHPSKRSEQFNDTYGLDDGLKLLYVGRVSKEKNLELLVEVYRSLIRSGDKISLVVVGDGPYFEEMKQELQDTPAVFTGYLQGEKLSEVFASSDVFVFPSTTDTFGNVVLEAQASGLPVIVTDSGGPQENLIANKTGLIVPGNDITMLIQAIKSLTANPDRRKEMGREARRYMEDRSFERCFEIYWGMYKEEEPTVAESDLAVAV
jgi:glycosyltransferase involved in cell wall biosynthesis